MVSSGRIMGPMGPGPMGNKSFGSPVQLPYRGNPFSESLFSKFKLFFGLCRLPYRGYPFSESLLLTPPPGDGGGDDGGGGGTHPARPAPSQHAQGPNIP